MSAENDVYREQVPPDTIEVHAFAMRMTQVSGTGFIALVVADDKNRHATMIWGPQAIANLDAYLTRFREGEDMPTEPGESWGWSIR